MSAKVSILIVNWNGKHHLEKCLPSLMQIDYTNAEIILVDNGSTDGSLEYISQNFPSVKIIKEETNTGFVGGNNDGINYATGDYVLFLNNDTRVEPDFLSKLVRALDEDQLIAGVQSKVVSIDDPNRYDSVGAFLTNTGFLYHYGYLQRVNPKFEQRIKLYTAKGACMLFRKSIINEVGLFDPDFFAYFEETDFCHRVLLKGFRIEYIPESVIHHKIGGTSNAMNNAFIQFHSFKNRINSHLKNLGTIEMVKILPLHLILCEMAAIVFLFRGRADLFKALNKSIYWNIQNFSQTMAKRKKVQAMRKISDRELLKDLKIWPGICYFFYLFAKDIADYEDTINIGEQQRIRV